MDCRREHEPQFDHTLDELEHVLFRVAMLRDLTALSPKDRRALEVAYSNLDGVRKRREAS